MGISPDKDYTALQLYSVLHELAQPAHGTDKPQLNGFAVVPGHTYNPAGGVLQSAAYFLRNGQTLVTAPAIDDKFPQSNATVAAPINDVLRELNKVEWNRVMIPIAQSNKYFFGLLTRRHYTYLELNKDQYGNIAAHHHDPKGWLSSFYPLKPIKDALDGAFQGKFTSFKQSYHGQQGVFDNINCGRYVLSYICNKVIPGLENTISDKPEKNFRAFDQLVEQANQRIISKNDPQSVGPKQGTKNEDNTNKLSSKNPPGPHSEKYLQNQGGLPATSKVKQK
jgi:hypothetical protein